MNHEGFNCKHNFQFTVFALFRTATSQTRMLQVIADQIMSTVADIYTPCRQCTADSGIDTLKIRNTLSARRRNLDDEDKLLDIIDIANDIELDKENVDPSDITALINSKTVELIMNIPPLTNRSKASQSMPFLKSESPPPEMDLFHCFTPHYFSPRVSRAFSLNDPQHLPYIISETQSEISTPIYDEETTDSNNSTLRSRTKPNVYTPFANDLWNDDEINDLHEEMSQQFARLTKRLSVDSIHSFNASRSTFNKQPVLNMNEQMLHLAELHNDAIECKL